MSKILYLQYTNPAAYPPLEQSSQLLAQDGWEALFLGTGVLGAYNLTFPSHPNITVKQIPFCLPGWRQKVHYAWFWLWVIFWTFRWKPQWVYASELLSCPIGYSLSFFPNVNLIYHEHDSPESNPSSGFLKFCLTTRKKLIHRAACSILPNQQRADIFDKSVDNPSRSLCVWNCPRQAEIVKERAPWDGKTLWVLYHGSIVPARLPLTVLYALSKLPALVKLRVIGYQTTGHSNYVQTMRETAEKLDLLDRVEFIDAMPRHQLLSWCQQSDIGLAFMPITTSDINLNWMTGASNKPFDYLACGLPLLVSNMEDWQEMYVEPGYALATNPEDSDRIAEALRWYLDRPQEMRNMGEQGRQQMLKEWNYENQFAKVKNLLNNRN